MGSHLHHITIEPITHMCYLHFDPTDPWNQEVDPDPRFSARVHVFRSDNFPLTITSRRTPLRFRTHLTAGSSSPRPIGRLSPFVPANRYFWRVLVLRRDGRVSLSQRGNTVSPWT